MTTGRVSIETVRQQPLAAVIERVAMGDIGSRVGPNLGKITSFLTAYPEYALGKPHAVFVYRGKDNKPSDGMIAVEYAMEVERPFPPSGDIKCTSTPAGRVASAMHSGSYHLLPETHGAVQRWCAQNGHTLAGIDWEIYGDYSDDPSKLETKVCYLLK